MVGYRSEVALPMARNCSSVEDRQSFVDGEPYQPTAKGALAIKCRDVLGGRIKTIVYSNSGSVRIAEHAVCDKIQQAAISRCPNIKRHPGFPRTVRDRNAFV